ncbi:GDNF/GAS1 domain protein [Ancylostoma duodenale]|uniref:GDNF/GAS1 domain protein n=1 Tax=Ancylostoma duodenale TaxID=51022 RepID=A0A0C2GIC6_9BILA|nr:GDNF/GAS1 domain protein [Ancylostoma duodenale]
MLYPKCLYSTTSMAMTCTEAARKCDTDHRCRHLRHSLSANCPVSHDECTKTSLDECRRTILHARASILEQPCYCPLSDVECMAHQRTMIPNNPCIEKAMLEYSRLMGYNTPTAAKSASIETNRVYESNVEEAVTKDPSRHHQEKTRTGVDNRGVSKPSEASHFGNRRTHIGQDEHSRKTAETEEKQSTNRYRTKDWKEKEVKSDAKEWNEKSEVAEAEAEQQRGEGWQIGTSSISQTGEQRVVSSTEESGKIADVDGGSSTTTKPEKTMTTWSSHKKTHTEGRRKGKHRTTVSPLDPTEPPPPWVTTTEQLPTTTTTFVTHAPPPPEGCNAKDASGRQIFVHTGAVIRGLQCRIVLMPEMSEPGSAFMRVEWFGKNEALNHTKTQWHTGGAEKACSPYAKKLQNHFELNESPRFQLVLSSVKQLKVLDHLDGLPSSASNVKYLIAALILLIRVLVQ